MLFTYSCETPLTFVTFCPIVGLRPNLSTAMFIISPKFVDYFLQPFSFLHLFQNRKTKMSAKKRLPRLNLLSWIEHIAKIVVHFSWPGQSKRVKIPLIISSFEPCDPVHPISRSVVLVHNCALISFWFLWQSVTQENTTKVFQTNLFHPHLRFQSCSEVCLEEPRFQLGCSFILNKTFRFLWKHLINFQIHFFKLNVCFILFSRLRKNILKL